VKPLDIIVWRGHNRIVLDKDTIIESTVSFASGSIYTEPNGVRTVGLIESLDEIINDFKRSPVNDWNMSTLPNKEKFVIRRWYPGK
jgi:hypothetical protein